MMVRVLASKQTPCPSGAEVAFWAHAFLSDELLRGDKEDAVRLLPWDGSCQHSHSRFYIGLPGFKRLPMDNTRVDLTVFPFSCFNLDIC